MRTRAASWWKLLDSIPSNFEGKVLKSIGQSITTVVFETTPNENQAMAKRVLIVDDAIIMRRRIKQIAEEAGWVVAAEASNGEEAVTLYQQEQPDLVTLDIVMPKMDGVTALKSLIATDPNARVVMISAVDQKDKLMECIQNGAIDFIVKPFDKLRLRSFFDKHLAVNN
jgi:two-component system chemotaxis response regulator CheY